MERERTTGQRITFVGAGNMGGAIAYAVSKVGAYELYIYEPNEARRKEMCDKCNAEEAGLTEVSLSEVVVLGVKPQVLGGVIQELPLSGYPLYISMAAGISLAKLESMLPKGAAIIRIMPNTAVEVGQGMVLYCANDKVDEEDEQLFRQMFAHAGRVDKLEEKYIDAASAVSGCGPAFVYMFIEALADGAVACGLPRDKALLYAEQTLVGAASMAINSPKHPECLKDEVCSPGGSTIEGVMALEQGGMRAACINAVVAAYRRTKELGK